MNRAAIWFTATSLFPVPLLVLAAIFGGLWGWAALIYMTLLAFGLDMMIRRIESDQEFPAGQRLLVVLGLSHFLVLGLAIWSTTGTMPMHSRIALFLAVGLFMGQIGNANAHELIHRQGRVLRALGRWVYISMLFGHHSSAHTLVHHRFVGTDDDPATARAGEGFFSFVLRAWTGSFAKGLEAENARRADKAVWQHPYVEYVGGAVLCAVLSLALAGWTGLAALLGLALFAQCQLLLSDYVQHYGLERQMLGEKPEPVGPQHSWNAPHVFTGAMMLAAPRHSAHHTKPLLTFDALDLPDVNDAPYLPYSLPAMSVIALLPPLWRRVMDPRLAFWQAARFEPTAI